MNIFSYALANPTEVVSVWSAAAIIGQAVGRVIPDNKKGFLGVVRKISRVIGLYAKNNTGEVAGEIRPMETKDVTPQLVKNAIKKGVKAKRDSW